MLLNSSILFNSVLYAYYRDRDFIIYSFLLLDLRSVAGSYNHGMSLTSDEIMLDNN